MQRISDYGLLAITGTSISYPFPPKAQGNTLEEKDGKNVKVKGWGVLLGKCLLDMTEPFQLMNSQQLLWLSA